MANVAIDGETSLSYEGESLRKSAICTGTSSIGTLEGYWAITYTSFSEMQPAAEQMLLTELQGFLG